MCQPRFLVLLTLLFATGCTPLGEYLNNGMKVGPNYCPPDAMVAPDWIDAGDKRVDDSQIDMAQWWTVFGDPSLDALIRTATRQNLTLREAGFRVLQARAARAIAAGNLFPQQQAAVGGFARNAASTAVANRDFLLEPYFDQWDAGFNLAWELDFWGRFRRAVEAADADLDAQVAEYDHVMVTLFSDVAAAYVEIRTLQQRIALARENVRLQRETNTIADARYRGGQVSELDVDQAAATLAQTEALIPQLELRLRETSNLLCILMGIPPTDLQRVLGTGPIPSAPGEVVVGVPADLLRRRPDVRRAEREVAAQSARVGVATAELYPHIGIGGALAFSSEDFSDLLSSAAFQGNVGPTFRWNILNYGRLINSIRLQDVRLAERMVRYQNQVLRANAEVENGIAQFLHGIERARWLDTSVAASEKAARIALAQYKGGIISFNWLAMIQQDLVQRQELLAQAQGETVLGLVETYRALGGGWEPTRPMLPMDESRVGPLFVVPSLVHPSPEPEAEILPTPDAEPGSGLLHEAEPISQGNPVTTSSRTTWTPPLDWRG